MLKIFSYQKFFSRKHFVLILIFLLSITLISSQIEFSYAKPPQNSGGGKNDPVITSVEPNSGSTDGGTIITINGNSFHKKSTVTIGGIQVSPLSKSSTSITAETPPHPIGAVDIVVTNPNGRSATLVNGFTYVVITPPPTISSINPNVGTTNGGTVVEITGSDFVDGAVVTFGVSDAPIVVVDSSQKITATTPANAAGLVDVTVTNPDGLSNTLTNGFEYVIISPTISSINPNIGIVLGGLVVEITGSNFVDGAVVTFGVSDAPIVVVDSSQKITATTPANVAGLVDVTVTNPNGLSNTLTNGFEYLIPIFADAANVYGVDFHHKRGSVESMMMPLGGGVGVADINNDSWLDIYVTNSDGSNALYRNNGDGTFDNIAVSAGVDDSSGMGNGVCFADYDNDGDLDFYLTNWGTSKLFRNNGDETFSDVTAIAGLGDPDPTYRSMGCAWGDYDDDGLVELIVVRHLDESDPTVFETRDFSTAVRPLSLYHNEGSDLAGNWVFTDVTELLGDPNVFPSDLRRAGFQPVFVDFDNDGDQDIYVVNDFNFEIGPNVLWKNDGPDANGDWIFTNVSSSTGAEISDGFLMGIAIGDYDDNGYLDFYMTNIGPNILLNNVAGTFTDKALEAGVQRTFLGTDFVDDRSITWGTLFLDYDNDGDLDIYLVAGYLDSDPLPIEQPNVLFRNDGNGLFTDVTNVSGAADVGVEVGRGAAYGDFNNDGCIDMYIVNLGQLDSFGIARLFQNNCLANNNWLVVNTIGTISNHDGIGARIKVTTSDGTQIREISSGGSHMSHNMLSAHFGLGSSMSIDIIEIQWPSGIIQTLTNIPANQILEVTEPSS